MVSNKLVDSVRTRNRRGLPARPAYKKGCDIKEFLETMCYGDADCQQCLNTYDAFCNNKGRCDYKTKWLMFPMQKLPKFERELEMNKNDALDLPSFNLSVDNK